MTDSLEFHESGQRTPLELEHVKGGRAGAPVMFSHMHDGRVTPIFSPASGPTPLASHQRFPADGLFGDDELTGHGPSDAAMISLTRLEAGRNQARLTDCPMFRINED